MQATDKGNIKKENIKVYDWRLNRGSKYDKEIKIIIDLYKKNLRRPNHGCY